MLLTSDDYGSLVDYLAGYASGRGTLHGFKEFVELRYGATSEAHWSGLALRVDGRDRSQLDDEQKKAALLDLLEEFLIEVGASNDGLRRVFHEWVLMVQAAPDPEISRDLIRYARSPPPDETLGIEDIANELGITRRRVFELLEETQAIARTGREGAHLVVPLALLPELRVALSFHDS
jgi:hypothetical protein